MRDLSNIEVIQENKKGISLLKFRSLLKYEPNLIHGYTMKDLNFKGSEKFSESLEMLQNSQGVQKLWIKTSQTHSKNIITIKEEEEIPEKLENVDGIITNKKNLLVLTFYADCTPILIYDIKNHVIANVHSGWRGTTKRIAANALKQMIEDFNTNPRDCEVTIGPNIQDCCFEVGKDVKEIFCNEFKTLDNFNNMIKEKKNISNEEKYLINTTMINKNLLKDMGVLEKNIHESNICTKCNSKELHSYRADGNNSGRSTMFTILK